MSGIRESAGGHFSIAPRCQLEQWYRGYLFGTPIRIRLRYTAVPHRLGDRIINPNGDRDKARSTHLPFFTIIARYVVQCIFYVQCRDILVHTFHDKKHFPMNRFRIGRHSFDFTIRLQGMTEAKIGMIIAGKAVNLLCGRNFIPFFSRNCCFFITLQLIMNVKALIPNQQSVGAPFSGQADHSLFLDRRGKAVCVNNVVKTAKKVVENLHVTEFHVNTILSRVFKEKILSNQYFRTSAFRRFVRFPVFIPLFSPMRIPLVTGGYRECIAYPVTN